jgi:hypothetical protein
LLGAVACGGNESPPPATAGKSVQYSELETYFPLVDGKLYAYLGHTEGSPNTLVVFKVERKSKERGVLKGTAIERAFIVKEDSISRVGGGTVLQKPLREGTSFLGDHGGRTTITEMGVAFEGPSGRYSGCLRTEEEPTPMFPGRTRTTFCPGIGVVRLEVIGAAKGDLLELQSYGDPVRIE